MKKSEKKKAAEEFLSTIKDMGITPTIEGNFVVFKQPLPIELMMQASLLSDELHAIVSGK